jgi:hypothetical protein
VKLRSLLVHLAALVRDVLPEVRGARAEANAEFASIKRALVALQEGLGRVEARQNAAAGFRSLQESEFKVFSQWGEDGIIQALVREVPVPHRVFVEFGVENYTEANTRFLLLNCGWRGLVMDGDRAQVEQILASREHWMFDLRVAHAFVTRGNINALLREHDVTGDIGLLSIDIDGNDYWIWEAIEGVTPAIVVAEYNYRFGPTAAVTIPYRDDFSRFEAHPSWIYYGASLAALCLLAERKGYDFVGCGRAGVNAFFVRKDLRPASVPALTAEEGFVRGTFAEPYALGPERTRARAEEEMERVWKLGLPLVDVANEQDGTR